MMTKDYPYLYLNSLREAKRYNEVSKWVESHKQNVACRDAIEQAIRNGFDGMHLDRDCAQSVIEDYGFKRVGWVLSNTIQQKSDDGRFSPYNKTWACQTFIPPSDRNHDFVVGSHPAVLDGFVTEFRDALAELQMFDHVHCDSLTGEELTGRVLVMSPSTLKESYWAPENQLWYATGGFGCTPTAAGRAVYATCLGNVMEYLIPMQMGEAAPIAFETITNEELNKGTLNKRSCTCIFRHGEDDFAIWDVDLPVCVIEQVKLGQRSTSDCVEDLLRGMSNTDKHSADSVSLLVWDRNELALYTSAVSADFIEQYSSEGCSVRADLDTVVDEIEGPETEIDIMWNDLKPETQRRIMRMLGDNGNYDTFPITTIYAPDMDQGMKME